MAQKKKLDPILARARPKKPTKARVRKVEGVVVVELEDGALAIIPEDELCNLAERLNLVVDGYRC